jgi:hypothetical protein
MKELAGLRWVPLWTSHIGCLAGCARHLGIAAGTSELFGGTGHAFIANLHERLCPSGPTTWRTDMLFELSCNLGIEQQSLSAAVGERCPAGLPEQAEDFIRDAIDRGRPCYGWELDIPEFYVIYGYDDSGCYISGPLCDEGRGPVPWESLTRTGTGWMELYSCGPCRRASLRKTLREAFIGALAHAGNTEQWVMEHYRSGPDAFLAWAAALAEGRADPLWGVAYNAEVVHECRSHAVRFLEDASSGIESGRIRELLLEATSLYREVAESVAAVREEYPFRGPGVDPPVTADGVERAVLALELTADRERCVLEIMEAAIPLF